MQPNTEHYADKYYELATQGRQCYKDKVQYKR